MSFLGSGQTTCIENERKGDGNEISLDYLLSKFNVFVLGKSHI